MLHLVDWILWISFQSLWFIRPWIEENKGLSANRFMKLQKFFFIKTISGCFFWTLDLLHMGMNFFFKTFWFIKSQIRKWFMIYKNHGFTSYGYEFFVAALGNFLCSHPDMKLFVHQSRGSGMWEVREREIWEITFLKIYKIKRLF